VAHEDRKRADKAALHRLLQGDGHGLSGLIRTTAHANFTLAIFTLAPQGPIPHIRQ
jgi:hypothetical protein